LLNKAGCVKEGTIELWDFIVSAEVEENRRMLDTWKKRSQQVLSVVEPGWKIPDIPLPLTRYIDGETNAVHRVESPILRKPKLIVRVLAAIVNKTYNVLYVIYHGTIDLFAPTKREPQWLDDSLS
jgi:hypothetical protein